MPRYRFSWDSFSDKVVDALAYAYGYREGEYLSRREWLSETVKRPHDRFVKKTKKTIEDFWLVDKPNLSRVYSSTVDQNIVR